MLESFSAKCTVCGTTAFLCSVGAGVGVPRILHPESDWYSGTKWKEANIWDFGAIDGQSLDRCPKCLRLSPEAKPFPATPSKPTPISEKEFNELVRLDMFEPSEGIAALLRAEMHRWRDALTKIVQTTTTHLAQRKQEADARFDKNTQPREYAQSQIEYASWARRANAVLGAAQRKLGHINPDITAANIAADIAKKKAIQESKAAVLAASGSARIGDISLKVARAAPVPYEAVMAAYNVYSKIVAEEGGIQPTEWETLSAAEKNGGVGR